MAEQYQGVNKIAERLNITDNAVRQRIDRGTFPAPDVIVDTGTKRTPGWSEEVIERYLSDINTDTNNKKEN
jgi:hypothetical protein|nr:MAG TPA: Pyocin activator protein PrtN [Caudoviricetes sp.]